MVDIFLKLGWDLLRWGIFVGMDTLDQRTYLHAVWSDYFLTHNVPEGVLHGDVVILCTIDKKITSDVQGQITQGGTWTNFQSSWKWLLSQFTSGKINFHLCNAEISFAWFDFYLFLSMFSLQNNKMLIVINLFLKQSAGWF